MTNRPQPKHGWRYGLAAAFIIGGLTATNATPARAEGILNWEVGGAAPLGNINFTSQWTGASLSPDSPVYFQTMVSGGYRFKLAPWFFIAPMGYYRLTAGILEYRDINYPFDLKTDFNLFYQNQYIGNELAAGVDVGFVLKRWTIVPGFYIGARNNLTKVTSRYYNDREVIEDGPWRTNWDFVITPRLVIDYQIAPGVDMGGAVDYGFAPDKAAQGTLNFAIRAAFHF
ncbi:MAG: hypothetical protein QM529_07455 [Hydrotalea sp.]|nr:hypothetical protein [Hydrotalea sp.]